MNDAIRVSGLSLVAAGRPLLEGASLVVARGEFVLLVGASGTGKSLTLSLLLGLLADRNSFQIRGDISVLGTDPRVDGPAPGVAVVFQDFALFDDWDAATNVAFAADHARGAGAVAPDLLSAFGLPGRLRPAAMSGGQKQRLAIARALASRPELVFYDEPTSGLDPAMSTATARRLRDAHDRGGMTTVAVSHDVATLAPIADRVVLLDPGLRAFRDVAKADLDAALAALRTFAPPEPPLPERRTIAATAASWPGRATDAIGRSVLAFGEGLAALPPRAPSLRWALQFLRFYSGLLIFGSALPFLCLAGATSGFVVAFFVFALIPYAGFTEPVLIEEIAGALGYALQRVVAPGTLALLFAARGGAAAAADFGRRTMSRQTDALRVMGAKPERYLYSAALWASLLGAPILWYATWKCSAAAASLVFLATHPSHGAYSFQSTFGSLIDGGRLLSEHVAWSLGKTLVCVFGTLVVAWRVGRKRPDGGADLARGVTNAVIRATLWTLLVQLVFAFFEFGDPKSR